MKYLSLFILIWAFLLSPKYTLAQEDLEKGIITETEVIEVGTIKVLVPKDAEVRKEGNLVITEGINVYMVRRFKEIQERFTKLEAELEQLKKTLEEIKNQQKKVQ